MIRWLPKFRSNLHLLSSVLNVQAVFSVEILVLNCQITKVTDRILPRPDKVTLLQQIFNVQCGPQSTSQEP